MAERRMFAKTIVDSDAFLDMPTSSQNLYFHLSMRADDDGFINNPKKIQRMVNASDDDLRILCAKSFIIPFDSGVVVIKHWRISNYLRSDRYKETVYQEEKSSLEVKPNGAYTLKQPKNISGIPAVYQLVDNRETQVSIGKVSIGKDREETPDKPAKPHFITPTSEEVAAYCKERRNRVDPVHFVDYYEARGWMLGKKKMVDWKAAVRTWERNDAGGKKETIATMEPQDWQKEMVNRARK
jgi:hypothetical protein